MPVCDIMKQYNELNEFTEKLGPQLQRLEAIKISFPRFVGRLPSPRMNQERTVIGLTEHGLAGVSPPEAQHPDADSLNNLDRLEPSIERVEEWQQRQEEEPPLAPDQVPAPAAAPQPARDVQNQGRRCCWGGCCCS